jgi:uncharacterized protein (TIGR01244 family)
VRRATLAFLVVAAALSVGSESVTATRFHQIDGRVWVGGQPSEEDLALFCGAGVRTVVDLREDVEHDVCVEEMAATRLGMMFVHIPVRPDAPGDRDVDAFLAVTARFDAFPMLIHCASGNRAAAFWMIRRLVVDGWPADAAENEARRIGLRSASLRDFALDYASRRAATDDAPEEDEP